MPIPNMSNIGAQIAGALKTKAASAAGAVKTDLSIVQQASRLAGGVARRVDEKAREVRENYEKSRRSRREGVYYRVDVDTKSGFSASTTGGGYHEGVHAEGVPKVTAKDGYVRKTPVQTLRVPADYRRKLIWKIIGAAAVIVLILAAVYALFRSALITL